MHNSLAADWIEWSGIPSRYDARIHSDTSVEIKFRFAGDQKLIVTPPTNI